MPRLSLEQRNVAVGMVIADSKLQDAANYFGCCHSTISRLLKRKRDTGSVRDMQRSGRPRCTTPRQDRQIRVSHLRDRFRTAAMTAQETPGISNPRISVTTVRRRRREAGLHARHPYVGPTLNRERRCRRRCRRRRWCRQVLEWKLPRWNRVHRVVSVSIDPTFSPDLIQSSNYGIIRDVRSTHVIRGRKPDNSLSTSFGKSGTIFPRREFSN